MWLSRSHGAGAVTLAADGVRAATAGLFAAALSRAVGGAAVRGPLASYRDVVETEIWQLPVAVFIPGVIGRFEPGDVAGLAAPRPLSVSGAVGGGGRPLRPAAARGLSMSRAEGAYAAAGAKAAFSLRGATKAAAFEREIARVAREVSE